MTFKLDEVVVVNDDGKWRPLEWNSRSVLGVITKVKNRKKVRIRFEYCDEIYEVWFKFKKRPYGDDKCWFHNGGFLNYYTAVKLSIFQKEMKSEERINHD